MEGFERRFGSAPQGVWAAPGRVNVIGEHTDYNDGFVLPVALRQRTRAAVSLRQDGRLRLASRQSDEVYDGTVDALEPGRVEGWARYAAGVVWAFREDGHAVPGLDLLVDSDVPIGAGLSSSAALECSVAVALSDLLGTGLGRPELAVLARRAENDFAGVPSGILDQSASLRCTEGHALFMDCRSGEVEQVPFDLRRHGLVLLVVDTRAHHELGDGQYSSRRQACHEAAAAIGVPALRDAVPGDLDKVPDPVARRRARHVVTENQRVLDVVALLRDDRVPDIGPVLTASHASMRDDFEISVAELDLTVETVLAAGALGARMTGGGFGGSAIALVAVNARDACVASVEAAFAQAGFEPPACFDVVPSSGAGQVPH